MGTHHSHRLFGATLGVSRSTHARRVAALATAACLTVALALAYDDAGAQSAVVPTCQGLPATIVGNDNPNFLVGGPGVDVIVGKKGNDIIWGLGGDDVICGNEDEDELHGGDGDDRILGNGNDDHLFGGNGVDFLDGGPHDHADTCNPGPGADPAPINCAP
ncbi:MAG: hypothetical protein QOD83_1885 [Solirubrobacteraceae bacterium]|nr:hypothetical protein [Solirubrobacteraceae bacterium]